MTERDKFEAWAKKKGWSVTRVSTIWADFYVDLRTDAVWPLWEAEAILSEDQQPPNN